MAIFQHNLRNSFQNVFLLYFITQTNFLLLKFPTSTSNFVKKFFADQEEYKKGKLNIFPQTGKQYYILIEFTCLISASYFKKN